METNKKKSQKAAISLIVSSVGVLSSCVWYVAILLGVLGVVLGILALREENCQQRELAIAGIVVGAVAVALAVVSAVLLILIYSALEMPSSSPATTPTPGGLPSAAGDTVAMLAHTIFGI